MSEPVVLLWRLFAELDEAIASSGQGCACDATTHFGCAAHRAFDRVLDATRAHMREAHVHSWGPLKAIPPDGDLGRECDNCGEYQKEVEAHQMCWCTPEIRTPWCGKPTCQRPKPETSGASPLREPHGWEMPKVVKVRCSVDLVE